MKEGRKEGERGDQPFMTAVKIMNYLEVNLTENVFLRLLWIKLQITPEEYKRSPEISREIPCSCIRRQHRKDIHFPQTKLNIQCKHSKKKKKKKKKKIRLFYGI